MTLDEINSDIALYQAARDAILSRKVESYTINNRTMTFLDLAFIEKKLTELRSSRDRTTNGTVRVAQFIDPE